MVHFEEQLKFIEKNVHRLKCVTYFQNIPHLLRQTFRNLTRLKIHYCSPLNIQDLMYRNYPPLLFLEIDTLVGSLY